MRSKAGREAGKEGLAIMQSRDDDSLTSEHGGRDGKLLILAPQRGRGLTTQGEPAGMSGSHWRTKTAMDAPVKSDSSAPQRTQTSEKQSKEARTFWSFRGQDL